MALVGADGRTRCPWPGLDRDAGYLRYHDEEWGVPVHGTVALFERLSLEAFQSGLSWLTILRKRPAFRAAFAGFDPAVLAAWGAPDVARLLTDPGIVRNRSKIVAVLANARAVRALDTELDPLLWCFAPPPRTTGPPDPGTVPTLTPESTAMARELRRRGFAFVGPTTAYALMQAVGMVDDHVAGCWRAGHSG